MGKLSRVGGAGATVVAVALALSATSCSISGHPVTRQAPSESRIQVLSDYPDHFPLIGEMSSKRGTAEIGPYPTTSDKIAVFVRCYGTALMRVEIPGVASFTQWCVKDIDDLGTMNVLDVRYVDTVTVRGSSDNSSVWAVAVTTMD